MQPDNRFQKLQDDYLALKSSWTPTDHAAQFDAAQKLDASRRAGSPLDARRERRQVVYA